ncbi:hypothetical protein ACFL6I_16185, partial [candidate division KSB1 bacterium]
SIGLGNNNGGETTFPLTPFLHFARKGSDSNQIIVQKTEEGMRHIDCLCYGAEWIEKRKNN